MAKGSDRQRQKRLQAKRTRREKRRKEVRAFLRASVSPSWSPSLAASPPKASEVLLDVAEPLLEAMPDDVTAERYEGVLTMVALFWNASVLGETEGPRWHELVAGLAAAAGGDEDLTEGIARMIVERKQALHPDDRRMLLGVRVGETEDGFHVSCASSLG